MKEITTTNGGNTDRLRNPEDGYFKLMELNLAE